ncbi:MAG: hypothetical protein LBH47_03465 [Christensenellaceae bacterium]|nr:hypothetical protein [Christensenellaceae bacterium]
MRFSNTLIPTLKEIPNDCDKENAANVLLHRAGFLRRTMNGFYTLLPLYLRSIQKIAVIIRKEMEDLGCLEILFSNISSKEVFIESGRWDKFGGEMFRLFDRNKREMALSPTNEESACFIAKSFLNSYTQLPFAMFQIQKKYRDEIRPRGGLMRGREFTMKDCYSFHLNDDDLHNFYNKMRAAYTNIFNKIQIKAVPVAADNGAMGGKVSEEFIYRPTDKTKEEVELGHIFELGNYYTEKMNLSVTSKSNASAPLTMGCYGIGLDRCIYAVVDSHKDANGIVWPNTIAPYLIYLTFVREENRKIADKIYKKFNGAYEILYDDREMSAGIKFKDADLIGIPYRIIIGKDIENDEVEFISRDGSIKKKIKIKEIKDELRRIIF